MTIVNYDTPSFFYKNTSPQRKYLRWAMKVLAMTNESTFNSQRKYFHFLRHFRLEKAECDLTILVDRSTHISDNRSLTSHPSITRCE